MKPSINLRTTVTDFQVEQLRQRLSILPFKVHYQEEQHGPHLVVVIGCTTAQEKIVREILKEIGVSIADSIEA